MKLRFSCLIPLLFNRYCLFLLFLVGATSAMEAYGGLPSVWPARNFEIPFLLYLYGYFNLILRKSRWQPWLAAAPLVLCYAAFDGYYYVIGRLLRITEVTELPEMFQVLPSKAIVLIVLVVGLPMLAFLLSLRWRRFWVLALGALPLLGLTIAVELFPEEFMAAFYSTQKEIVFYSDTMSAGNNGRLAMMLFNEARRRSYVAKIASYRGRSPYTEEFEQVIAKLKGVAGKRNVHLLVLESFMDPRLLRKATFSRSPVHPSFAKLFGEQGGMSISPVFGGGTAQAEFEVLCGVPAMRELSGIEFDVFTGAKTLCLPNILAQSGYQAVATNAFLPEFFNSINAYDGLGFEKTYYAREYAPLRESYFSTGDLAQEKYMFDGELLRQNLDFVARKLQETPAKPLFNYVISIYGHLPHDLNLDKRPKVVKLLGDYKDEQLENSANQFYYRTEALATYVEGLRKIDPQSLIILLSDHLPPLDRSESYKELGYLDGADDFLHLNRIYFVENNRLVQFNTIHHYEVPKIILNYISQGKYCQDHTCRFTPRQEEQEKVDYRHEYMSIMAQAMESKDALPDHQAASWMEHLPPAESNLKP